MRIIVFGARLVLVVGFLFLTFTGKTKWSGRSLTLLGSTYAKKYRLLLVLAPAARIMGGIGVSSFMRFFTKSLRACVASKKIGQRKVFSSEYNDLY